jgi:hypothetical protein
MIVAYATIKWHVTIISCGLTACQNPTSARAIINLAVIFDWRMHETQLALRRSEMTSSWG